MIEQNQSISEMKSLNNRVIAVSVEDIPNQTEEPSSNMKNEDFERDVTPFESNINDLGAHEEVKNDWSNG